MKATKEYLKVKSISDAYDRGELVTEKPTKAFHQYVEGDLQERS